MPPRSTMWFIARTVSSIGVVTSGLWQNTKSTYSSLIRRKALCIPSTMCFRESPRSFTPLPPSKIFVEITRSDRRTSPDSKSCSSASCDLQSFLAGCFWTLAYQMFVIKNDFITAGAHFQKLKYLNFSLPESGLAHDVLGLSGKSTINFRIVNEIDARLNGRFEDFNLIQYTVRCGEVEKCEHGLVWFR